MYYDQLIALDRDLQILLVRTINDYTIADSEKEDRINEIEKRLRLVKMKIKDYSLNKNKSIFTCPKKEEVKEYKKQVKHEFLTQVNYGYSLNEILAYLRDYYVNPGINLDKYITKLRHPYGYLDEGYFTYEDSSKVDTKLVLTPKAKRYLENVANVSLKK